MSNLISHDEAARIAADWGSLIRSGDPGAIFDTFPANGRPPEWSRADRAAALAYCDNCMRNGHHLDELDALRRYIEESPHFGLFVDSFDPGDVRDVLRWIKEDFDPGDSWGWVMSWLFDVAGELDQRGAHVPDALGYRPGVLGSDVGEDRADALRLIRTEALQRAALILNRYAARLKAADLDY